MTSKVLSYVLTGNDKSLSSTVNKAGKNVDDSSKKIGKSIRDAGKAFALAGVTVAGASIKMASDFQNSMQQINALAGVSQKQVNSWSKQILALGGTLPQAPKELAEGLYSIASSGIPASKAMETLKASARAAAAGLGTVQSVADAVSSALNAYRGTSLTASKSTDILVTAVKDGKAEADSFASSIGQVIPAASTLGVSFDQVAAAMASLTLTGSDAAESATQIRGIFNSLIKPTAQGGKALDAMGLSYAGLQAELKQKGLLATLDTLKAKIGGNKTAMTDIFPDVRALTGYLSLTGKNAGQVAGIFKDLKNSTGATDTAFKSASQTVQFKFNVALAGMKTDAIQLGSTMLPIIATILTALSKILSPLAQNKAAFAALGIGVLAFAAIVKLSMALISTSVRAALVSSVIGIAILALSIAITELLLHWNTVWTACRKVINVFRDAMVTALKAVVDYFLWWEGMIIHAAASAFGWIPGIGPKLKAAAKNFDTFRDSVNNALDGLKSKTVNVSVAMTASTNPYKGGITGRAAGGRHIRGPGGPTSDRAGLFALSDGEYVIRAKSVSKYGVGFMHALNAGHLRVGHRASGGGVNLTTHTPSGQAVGSAVWNSTVKLVKANWQTMLSSFAGAAMSGFGTGGSGGAGVQKWAGLVLQVLAMLNQSAAWLPTVLRRMNQESGGNQFAVNNWDSNALAGHPSMGLMQTIPGTFGAYAGPFAGLGIFNPLANIYAGCNYAIHAYGSLAGMNRAGGYALGGPVSFDTGMGVLRPGYTLAHNGTGRNEFLSTKGHGGATYIINVSPTPLARPADIGRVVVTSIREYEKRAGKGWRS